MASGAYKFYERNTRVFTEEMDFTGGMKFTNAPLATGENRVLVNYDLSDDKMSLKPRQGLRIRTQLHKANNTTYLTGKVENSKVVIRRIVERNNNMYPQTLVSSIYKDSNDNYVSDMMSLQLNALETEVTDAIKCTPPRTHIYPTAQVHDMDIASTIATPYDVVGTTAYYSNYYYMGATDSMYVSKLSDATNKFETTKVAPKVIDPTEAVTYGYNLLLDDPYNFVDDNIAGAVQLLGIMPHKAIEQEGELRYKPGQLELTPAINSTVCLRVYYEAEAGKKYMVVWETRDADNDAWTKVTQGIVNINTANTASENNGLAKVYMTTQVPTNTIMVRVSFYALTADQTELIETSVVEQSLTTGFDFNKEHKGSIANLDVKSYNINKAKGMTYWNKSLVVYGIEDDPTILFLSYVNDPSYFPYPNNVDIFDDPIRYAIPYLNDLVVFTSTEVWLLKVDATNVMGWTKTLIQSNLQISEYDMRFVQIVKNMIYFKSGNGYYMIVPKSSSTTGELTLAPVSRPLNGMYAKFRKSLKDIINSVYSPDDTTEETLQFTLRDARSYLDYEDIHNMYVLDINNTAKSTLTVDVIYNSVVRYWRIYIYQSHIALRNYTADATSITGLIGIANASATLENQIDPAIIFIDRTVDLHDNLLQGNSISTTEQIPDYKNWQYLDTGYHDYSLAYNKRFRELQFRFNNVSQKALHFGLSFLLDGAERVSMYRYSTSLMTSESNPNTATVFITRTLVNKLDVPGETILGDDATDINSWTLDTAGFPSIHLWKARIPISGKGYAPRFKLISRNEESYELLRYSWVFRELYLR